MTNIEELAENAIKKIESMTKEELREMFLKYGYDPDEKEGYMPDDIGVFDDKEPLFLVECA